MVVTGLAAGPCYVTALPEAIETYKVQHDYIEGVNPQLDATLQSKF